MSWEHISSRLSILHCASGTGTDPALPSEGLNLVEVENWDMPFVISITLEADPGFTIRPITAGRINAWIYDPLILSWSRCPDLDRRITGLGKRRQTYPRFQYPLLVGCRVAWIPLSVSLTGGGLTVYHHGFWR